MKICFVNLHAEYYTESRPGAIAIVIQGLAQELEARGHEVVVVTRESKDTPLEGGRVVYWRYPPRSELSLVARGRYRLAARLRGWDWGYYGAYRSLVAELVRSERPDFVAAHNDPYAATWLPGTGVARTAIWLHNKMGPYHRSFQNLTSVDWLLVPSAFLSEWADAHFITSPGGVGVVPNGADPSVFYPRCRERVPGPLRVLFVGRLDPNKGADLVPDAIACLALEQIEIHLTLVGRQSWWDVGPPRNPYGINVLSKAETLGAEWRGYVARSEMGDLYRAHDVVCIPSRDEEGFSLVAAEAMACGCAVITSGMGGLKNACGVAAIVVDTSSPSGLAQALRQLSADPVRLRAAQDRAARRGAELTWESAVSVLLKLLDDGPTSVRSSAK